MDSTRPQGAGGKGQSVGKVHTKGAVRITLLISLDGLLGGMAGEACLPERTVQ